MSKAVQRRRGTTAEHTTFTGALGELTVDTTKDTIVVHDGAVAGGFPLLREDGSNSALAIGSAGTPSLKFSGDPNTGLYSPGADQVAISTGGSQRLVVDASGNLLVGYNSDQGSGKFQVNGAGRIGVFDFNADDLTYVAGSAFRVGTFFGAPLVLKTSNTERMRITSDGNVGIGTSSPSYLLHAAGTGSVIVASQGTTDSAFLANVNGVQGLYVHSTTGLSEINELRNVPLTFNTNASERLRITSTGNVGIGTSSPSTVYRQTVNGDGSSVVGGLSLRNNGTETLTIGNVTAANDVDSEIWNPRNGYLRFATNNTERARIDSSGNMLLGGTASPTSAVSSFCIFNGTAPTASVANGVVLYAEDVSSSSELKVRDEAGNVTTLSPHNFDLIPEGPSEDMAWSYYSERDGKRINVDMLKAIRLLEQLTGEKLVYSS